MAAPWAIRVEGLGKQYELGEGAGRPRSLYESLSDALSWVAGRREGPPRRELFWALRGVSFEVAPGEVIGVVGRNGAGKSTLLKILSRITTPTEGRVLLRGNLASLLEVGTGFHPELTGRENVFLNGTILGMRRREIERKFDEIVAFAEVERFVDTPVKRYSSGMYVRLAFAVAAHLDADILLVDEVLAVGDAAFQRKSLGKMEDVARGGRTVLFVSHNLGAVRSLCSHVILLERGGMTFHGRTEEGLNHYEARLSGLPALQGASCKGSLVGSLDFNEIVFRQAGARPEVVDPALPLEIEIRGCAHRSFEALHLNIGVGRDGVRLFSCHDTLDAEPLPEGEFVSVFEIAAGTLRPGRHVLGAGAYRQGMTDSIWCAEAAYFDVSEKWSSPRSARDAGAVNVAYRSRRSR